MEYVELGFFFFFWSRRDYPDLICFATEETVKKDQG